MTDILNVTMFGNFSIGQNDNHIDDRCNRMHKVWLLLAYLIYSRNAHVTQDNYLALFQGSDAVDVADPSGRLKVLFYRARNMLNELYENAGYELIVRKSNTYAWNTEIPLVLDVECFEKLCVDIAQTASDEERLEYCRKALAIYQGDFLPKLSMEQWVMPISAYFHQQYLNVVDNALALLQEGELWEECASVCTKALRIEPYSESLYQHLMRFRIAMGDRGGAVAIYEQMSELFFETFGVMPSDESRQIYREATQQVNVPSISMGSVENYLKEDEDAEGAVCLEYDIFRYLYQVQARSIARTKEMVHIAMFSLHGLIKETISRRSLDTAMENFQKLLLANLRQGDVISKCSASQLIVMLPSAGYEDSCAVCKRMMNAFGRKYPHSPVAINFTVQPLEPHSPRKLH